MDFPPHQVVGFTLRLARSLTHSLTHSLAHPLCRVLISHYCDLRALELHQQHTSSSSNPKRAVYILRDIFCRGMERTIGGECF